MKKLYKNKFLVYSSGLITDLKGNDLRVENKKRWQIHINNFLFYAYQAVTECYHPDWFPKCIIHHLDKNSLNDNIDNLVICKTRKEHLLKFHLNEIKKNLKKATEISSKLPRTEKQLKACIKNLELTRIDNFKIKPEMEEQFLKDCQTMTRTGVAKKYKIGRNTVLNTIIRLGGIKC